MKLLNTGELTLWFSKGQKLHTIFHITGFACLTDDLKVVDALPDRNVQRVSIDHAAERFFLPFDALLPQTGDRRRR